MSGRRRLVASLSLHSRSVPTPRSPSVRSLSSPSQLASASSSSRHRSRYQQGTARPRASSSPTTPSITFSKPSTPSRGMATAAAAATGSTGGTPEAEYEALKSKPVAIIGAGAWGLSTALHLNRAGFTDVTVFERAETVPSQYSAAWDLNKIVRAEYEDPFYTKLALEAIRGWKTPLFGPYYHETGYVVAATGRAPQKAIDHLEAALSSIESDPAFASGIRRLSGSEDFRDITWQYTGPLSGFRGYYNRLAGYAHSSDTLAGIWRHCAAAGVRFVHGEQAGRVEELLYSGDSPNGTTGKKGRCTGLRTADGKHHSAALTICALGGRAAALVPGIAKFTVARSWSVAHVQLTKSEADLLRGIATTNVRDLGFFFEPDPHTRLFKLCPLGGGYTNTDQGTGVSLPPNTVPAGAGVGAGAGTGKGANALPETRDFIPQADELKLRALLRETFPWMADRPFVEQRLCWFNDTADSDYCIDYVGGGAGTGGLAESGLVSLSGDSGHGFKMMPVFGAWVVDLLKRGRQVEERWRWKGGEEGAEGKGAQDWAGKVSWRIGEGREYRDLVEEENRRVGRAKL